jgi:hypothetical protein
MSNPIPPTRIGFSFAAMADNLKKAALAAIVFASCLAIAVYAPRDGALGWLLSQDAIAGVFLFAFAVSGFLVVYLLVRAVLRSSVAPCPDCQAEVRGLAGGGATFLVCPACSRYLRREGALLHHVEDDCLWSTPVFETFLPRPPVLAACCVCCAPETRRIAYTWSYSVAPGPSAGTRVPKHYTDTLEIPYCSEHADGVSVTQAEPQTAVIAFRSYRYLREFCRANRTTPGSLIAPPASASSSP